MIAHAGGLPLEEMLPLVPGAGAALLFARAWLELRLPLRRSPTRARGAAALSRADQSPGTHAAR